MGAVPRAGDVLRVIAIDAVERAASGHPGAPMGMADIAAVLWRRYLKHNPADPRWPDRDRFVLSNGHGSMLLYGLLHLTGYDLTVDDLKAFRQLHSRTPGHPEYGVTAGVETTTGPLAQGLANAVGMALAESLLAAEFNRPGHTIVDHRTWVFVGDGCLMEGLSHEAASLAGTLGLGKLVVFYDDNGISIDGHVADWFADDTAARFAAYGWNVIPGVDGHDADEIDRAVREALQQTDRPTLICCKTVIGYGSPGKAGSHDVHGAPLGAKEAKATRDNLQWRGEAFEVPAGVYSDWSYRDAGRARQQDWEIRFEHFAREYPELAREFQRRVVRRALPDSWSGDAAALLAHWQGQRSAVATRKASQLTIERLLPALPELLGGSADLTPSNLTSCAASIPVRRSRSGNYLNYGVREFGMSAIMNGIALHGGLLPFGGTFLTFSDYCRNGIRMSALMGLRVIYVLTHDSVMLGEDGPTHQPVEHVATLRLIPNVSVWRPCDGLETAVAWVSAIERTTGPTCLVLSRQNLPAVERDDAQVAAVRKGGYVLRDGGGRPALVMVATGSEVALVLGAQARLADLGIDSRVVSMPSCDVFDQQNSEYRDAVLPPSIPTLAVEAGITKYWRAYVGRDGDVIGIDRFGESAPATELADAFGLTVDHVVARARALAERRRTGRVDGPVNSDLSGDE